MENTIPKEIKKIVGEKPENIIQYTKDSKGEFYSVSIREFYYTQLKLASALKQLGVKAHSHVGLISENRAEWLVIDTAVLSLRAADVPRGCDITEGEMVYILDFAECETVFVENEAQYKKLLKVLKDIPGIKNIITIEDVAEKAEGINTLTYNEVLAMGKEEDFPLIEEIIETGEAGDLATIIFTSGTTGDPKGVMLTQENFLVQVEHMTERISIDSTDIWLSVLPVWHSFERIIQYVSALNLCALGYSKPIGSVMLKDFAALKPTWMTSVPRIWDALLAGIYRKVNSAPGTKKALFYFFEKVGTLHKALDNRVKSRQPRFVKRNRNIDRAVAFLPWLALYPLKALGSVLVFKNIRKMFGGRFVAGVSGGGALPSHVDNFFSAAGILLLEGYGLTESAPILALRYQKNPVPGTIGPVFPTGITEMKIVDEEGNTLPPGEKGVLHAKGPQIMKGYLKKPELTAEAIDEDGWLNTGDLAIVTHDGEFKIVGRAKDTIVLLGGENIEPSPIESKMSESVYIQRAVALGQDKKYLSALIVADMENLKTYAIQNNISFTEESELADSAEIQDLIAREIAERINQSNGFKSFERICRFKILTKPFEVGKELSGKQDIKRHAIDEIYKKEIEAVFQ